MRSFQQLITEAGGLVSYSIKLLLGAALLLFLWGLVKFIFRVGGSEGKVEEGKNMMTWGLVALFVMVSVWGILKFIGDNLDLKNLSA